MIKTKQLKMMHEDVILVNTARGGIINEYDLHEFLTHNPSAHACVDVFEEEPYLGPLTNLHNTTLTAHMGSMTDDCRARMEIEACEEAARFAMGINYLNPVPEHEYLSKDK
jgi:D-3-phosphoglycerate dehydrogenase